MSRKELENQMGSLREKHQRDAASLKTQLSEAESQAKDFQKEVTEIFPFCKNVMPND